MLLEFLVEVKCILNPALSVLVHLIWQNGWDGGIIFYICHCPNERFWGGNVELDPNRLKPKVMQARAKPKQIMAIKVTH